jgi:hypothetical protein
MARWSQKNGPSPKREQCIQSVGSAPHDRGYLHLSGGGLFSHGRLALIPAPWFNPREGRPSQIFQLFQRPSFGGESGWAR